MNYKKTIAIIFAGMLLITGIIACRKTTGDPGPAGKNGSPWNYNAGSITGAASGLTAGTNAQFNKTYNLTYFNDVQDNYMYSDGDGGQYATITRYDATGESFVTLNLYIDDQGDISGESTAIRLVTKDSNQDYLYIGTGQDFDKVTFIDLGSMYTFNSSALTITNKSFNSVTGIIAFDYTIEMYDSENTTEHKLTLTGSLNADLFAQTLRKGEVE